MEQKAEKNMMKVLAAGLAVLIVIVILGGGILLVTSGSKAADSDNTIEKMELKVILPDENERKTTDQMTISVTGEVVENETGNKDESVTDGDYILAESNTRLLTKADISDLSLKELNYAKNEIYARHGRKFKSAELQEYFDSKSWYEGKYEGTDFDKNYSDRLLSEIEKKNAEFLSSAEKSMSENGYVLDQ